MARSQWPASPPCTRFCAVMVSFYGLESRLFTLWCAGKSRKSGKHYCRQETLNQCEVVIYGATSRNSSSGLTTRGARPWSTTYWATPSKAGRLDATP